MSTLRYKEEEKCPSILVVQDIENQHSMKEKSYHPISTCDDDDGSDLAISLRDMPPAHYTLEIDSFSDLLQILSKTGKKSYQSQIFEASGYKWKLSLYPNGNEERNGKEHISMYLIIENVKALPLGWEVNADFRFFVFDQIRDKYLTIQGRVRRFHAMKTERGFAQFLPHSDLHDASKGYLLHDKCVFGAEIFVIKYSGKGECLSQLENIDCCYTWKISRFSTLDDKPLTSNSFSLGNLYWTLMLYPKGDSLGKGKSLSLYLSLADSEPSAMVHAEFKLSIQDQLNSKDKERYAEVWVDTSGRGWVNFVPLSDIIDTSKGFLVNDTLVVQVQITRISPVKSFS